jgi:hypothetical protein
VIGVKTKTIIIKFEDKGLKFLRDNWLENYVFHKYQPITYHLKIITIKINNKKKS